jgi:pimeloyl-ACP methyl ester carboxylesterase
VSPAASHLPQPVAIAGCLGWLHLPEGTGHGRGVVICPPWGHEGLATGRGLHALGAACARAGIPALRLDYPGGGDSAGEDAPGRLVACRDAILDAAAWLRRHAGVAEVALCGLRSGAAFATMAAAQAPGEVDGLALLAPPACGRGLAREWLLRAEPRDAGSPWIELCGERLHRDDLAALERLDLAGLLAALPAPLLLLERRPALAPRLVGRARMRVRPFEGVDAFLTHAHAARVPQEAFAGVATWLAEDAPGAAAPRRRWPVPEIELGGGMTERALRFGPEDSFAGVLCDPGGRLPRRIGVLLLSTGTMPRAGMGRLGARLARRLAQFGLPSLRMDLRGIGDSAGVPGQADPAAPPDLYRDAVAEEARAGLDLLARHGASCCLVVGVCAGAHAALQLARIDERVGGVALFNLPAFDRAAGGAPALDGGPPPGETRWTRRPRMLLRRLLAEADGALAGLFGISPGLDRPRAWMRDFAARGVRVLLGYSARDRGLRELRAHFGRNGRRLAGQTAIRRVVLEGTDHSLAPRAMQEEVIRLVTEEALTLDLLSASRRRAALLPPPLRQEAPRPNLSHARAMAPEAPGLPHTTRLMP